MEGQKKPLSNFEKQETATIDSRLPYVLLVDDDDDQLLLFKVFLSRINCLVVTASSAAEALQIVQDVHIDLVITDVNMPGINGKEFIERLRSVHDTARLPVIAFSAIPEYLKQDVLSCGADAFCHKSETRLLLRRISDILSQIGKGTSLLEQVKERFEN